MEIACASVHPDGLPRYEAVRQAGVVQRRRDSRSGAATQQVGVVIPRVAQRGAEARQLGACDEEEEDQEAHLGGDHVHKVTFLRVRNRAMLLLLLLDRRTRRTGWRQRHILRAHTPYQGLGVIVYKRVQAHCYVRCLQSPRRPGE